MSETREDVQEHLRAASDAILLLVRQVEQLEEHKRGVRPGDPRFDELARAVRVAAQGLADFARAEEAWALDATSTSRTPVLDTISSSANPARVSDILARWRAVERQLDAAEPGSAHAAALFDEFDRLRDEYMDAFRDRSKEAEG